VLPGIGNRLVTVGLRLAPRALAAAVTGRHNFSRR